MDEQQIRKLIREELQAIFGIDKYIFSKLIQIMDGRNIQLGRTTGTKIGTDTDQKLAFFGGTPVDKPETVTDPTGGATIDAEARAAINTIIDRLQELTLIK